MKYKKRLWAVTVGAVMVSCIVSAFCGFKGTDVSGALKDAIADVVSGENPDNIMDINTENKNQKYRYMSYDISSNEKIEIIFNSSNFHSMFVNRNKYEEVISVEEQVPEETEQIEDIREFVRNYDEETVHNIVTGKNKADNRNYLPEDYGSINMGAVISRCIQLPVPYLSQYPELPTGCEVTSLTTVLNYFGYSVSKETMAASYLPKCPLEEGNYLDFFLGDPADEYSFGCYSSPIVTAANGYLNERGNKYKAYNYSGSSFDILLNEAAAGNPVILWSTIGLERPFTTVGWDINGNYVEWIAPEHCVVLTGYDIDAGTATISDPLQGIVVEDLNVVYLRYRQMCSQAVVIKTNAGLIEKPPIKPEETKAETETKTASATSGKGSETSSEGNSVQSSTISTESTKEHSTVDSQKQ